MREFLRGTDLELEDVYRAGRCFTTILHHAGLREGAPPKASIARALCRLLHVDDPARLDTWREWLRRKNPPRADAEDRMQLMLFAGLGFVREPL